jgi:hypothetical protein
MSSYEERMENFKEEKIAQILKAYKFERPIPPELKAEIDEFYGRLGYGCWFVSWLNNKIWCWLMVEWAKTDEEFKECIHWEDIRSDDEEERLTEPRYKVSYEDADPEDGDFATIEEARPLYDRLIATGEYGWVQIRKVGSEYGDEEADFIEEWENPNNCGACGFLVCECSEESVCDCDECNVQQ